MKTKYIKLKDDKGNVFTMSSGNRKVHFPIINLGSGTECPSRNWCPFHKPLAQKSGRNVCYAQKTEKLYPSVLKSRKANEAFIKAHKNDSYEMGYNLALKAIDKLEFNTLRLNESGDLAEWNIAFAIGVIDCLKQHNKRAYTYSKAPQKLQNMLRERGCIVLHSERDFVAVKSPEDTELPICPSVCGPCTRCPEGLKTAVIEH